MANVYRVGGVYGTEYFGTAKEADRCKPGGEEPEECLKLDAAGECNRLDRLVDETEKRFWRARGLLHDLVLSCFRPTKVTDNPEFHAAIKFLDDNPLSPADAGDRDGGRSYGI